MNKIDVLYGKSVIKEVDGVSLKIDSLDASDLGIVLGLESTDTKVQGDAIRDAIIKCVHLNIPDELKTKNPLTPDEQKLLDDYNEFEQNKTKLSLKSIMELIKPIQGVNGLVAPDPKTEAK